MSDVKHRLAHVASEAQHKMLPSAYHQPAPEEAQQQMQMQAPPQQRPPCALRKCQGRFGCLCVRQGPFAVAPRPARAEAERLPRPVTAPLPKRAPPKPPPTRRDPLEAYAISIGIDLKKEPALRWVAKEGMSAPVPSTWERPKAAQGPFGVAEPLGQYVEKATGKRQDAHPHHEYYCRLAAYVRGVLESQPGAEQPEPEPEPERDAAAAARRAEAEADRQTEADAAELAAVVAQIEALSPRAAAAAGEGAPPRLGSVGPWEEGRLARGFSEVERAGPEEEEDGAAAAGAAAAKPAARPKKKAKSTILNTSAAKSSRAVLRLICAEFGWRDEPCDNTTGNIFWAVNDDEISKRLERLRPQQRLARLPGIRQLTHKRPFAMLMRAAGERDPSFSRFFPKTWVFPDDEPPGASAFKRGPLIYKPSDGAQGDGIVLLNSKEDLNKRLADPRISECVVQRYLPKPLLLDGMKFDVRLYILVTSLAPLRVFACREGLVRVCTRPYEEPTARNSHQLSAHLTNYSINKYEAQYQHHDNPADGTQGSKRSLPALLKHLGDLGYDAEALEASMHDVAARTCMAMAGALRDEEPTLPASSLWGNEDAAEGTWRRAAAGEEGNCGGPKALNQCFHVLGFDLMFCEDADGQQQAMLLEVNANPSLAIDSCYPVVGPHACVPHPVPADAPWASACQAAMAQLPKQGAKLCQCRDHHRPHLHAPCAVDVVAKKAAVGGALRIVRRQQQSKDSMEALAQETAYVPIVDNGELL